MSAIFNQIFVFPPNDSPSKTFILFHQKKCLLFHQKSSFRSRDLQTCDFVPSFPHSPDTTGQIKVE